MQFLGLRLPFFFTITFILIFSITAKSQHLQGTITDAESGQPLPYVHVGILGKNYGTVSDENGKYRIELEGIAPQDSLAFSILGYQVQKFYIASIQSKSILDIFLQPTIYEIETLTVTDRSGISTKNIGYDKASKTTVGWNGRAWRGTEIAQPIEGLEGDWLLDFYCHIRFNMFDSVIFRLNIYENVYGQPGQSLLQENILLQIGKKQKWLKFDLRPYNLRMKGDVITSIEPIKTVGKGGLFFTYAKPEKEVSILLRPSSLASWEDFIDSALAWYFVAADE